MIIVSIALLAHLLVFIFLKPSYLEVFRSEVPGDEGSSTFRFINEALSTEPYPEYVEEIKEMSDPVEIVDDEEVLKSLISEIGEPALDVEPVNRGSRSGGSDGLAGPRRNTVEPKPLFMPWPKYPDGIDKDIRGKVELMLYVDEKGTVREIKLSRGLSNELLNETAIAA
ncbi:MAG TPA: hypothetical protein VLA34_00145, partial [Candidatus Krumholzibacterium sp.]|nr:hypothetical protein [Candidatus Krumholzibacterium sp.]